MGDIRKIQDELRTLYRSTGLAVAEPTLPMMSRSYAWYATDYLDAAALFEKLEEGDALKFSMPWFQLIGQALELAMKACIAAAGEAPGKSHDLVALCEKVELLTFDLGVEDIYALIVHLNHGYFEDLETGARFVARYGRGHHWVVPDHARIAHCIETLLEQARARAEVA